MSATLGEICEIQLGRAKNPSNRSGRYATPYLRAANITEDGLNLANVLQMDFPPREKETYRLLPGDLVISEASGSPDQVGKPAVWNEELPLCCFQNTVVRLRPIILSSKFVLAFLQHCYVNGVFASLAAGVGINHLGASRLSRIVVPVPPEDDQAEIVAEVNRQLGAARASRGVINASLEAAQLLRRSVLERAFAGRLVKPAASADPATRLLENLTTRRAEAASKPKAASAVRRINPMTFPPERRPLLDVIREHPAGITPEELLTAANYSADAIDDFYAELARIAGAILEEKLSGANLVRWPAEAHVLLRANAG